MQLAPGSRLGAYEIVSLLGSGGMGSVYRAHDPRLGRDTAIKVLKPGFGSDAELLRRFEKEARATSKLNHPSIVTIYDIGTEGDTRYIAMELVSGKTLRDVLSRGALPVDRALRIATDVADGLARAHAAGIVHRDLKPENIMVTADGRAKILDFGLVKLFEPDSEETTAQIRHDTATGVIVGTVTYMSPEQASGSPVDFRTDQFSFGLVLYEMLTGIRAFRKATSAETLAAIIRDEPQPVASVNAQVPVPLRWVVERCLAKDAANRYASTDDLARDLARLRDRMWEISGATAPAIPARRRRFSWMLPLVALLLLSAAGLAFYLRSMSRAPTAPPAFQRITFRRVPILGSRFARDGQSVVYSAVGPDRYPHLFVTRVDNPESTPLDIPPANLFAISHSGKLAVGTLHEGPEGKETLAEVSILGGAPRDLVDDVIAADYIGDSEQLAIIHANRVEFPVGHVVYTPPPGVHLRSLRVAPDANSAAFIEQSPDATSVRIISAKGKTLATGPRWGDAYGLAWSPDGREVFVGARFRERAGLSVHALDISGHERTALMIPGIAVVKDFDAAGRLLVDSASWPMSMVVSPPGSSHEREVSWLDFSTSRDLSADGTKLLFDETGWASGSAGAVYIRSTTDDSPATRLGDGSALALSPDGRSVLAIPFPNTRMFVLPTGAGEKREISEKGLAYWWGAWSPDGKTIVFGASRGNVAKIYAVDFPALGPPRLIAERQEVKSGIGSISPDGQWFAASIDGKLRLIPIHGGTPQELTGLAEDEFVMRWTADGRSIYLATMQFPVTISRFNVATRTRTKWKELDVSDRNGLSGLASIQITPDGSAYAYSYMRSLSTLFVVDGLK